MNRFEIKHFTACDDKYRASSEIERSNKEHFCAVCNTRVYYPFIVVFEEKELFSGGYVCSDLCGNTYILQNI